MPYTKLSDNDADDTGRMVLDDTHYAVSTVEDQADSKDYLPVVSDLDPDNYKRTGPMAKGGNPNTREQLDEDEKEAIDTNNIIEPRTRTQDPNSKTGKYTMLDPEEDEGLMAGRTPDGPFVEAVDDNGGFVEIAENDEEAEY